jgi:hypothetical protein
MKKLESHLPKPYNQWQIHAINPTNVAFGDSFPKNIL